MSQSLTRQTSYLIAGRALALPLAFLVPIILVRSFSVEDFGIYKQLFLLFYILIPIIDLGFTQSLYYFLPKNPSNRSEIVYNTILIQLVLMISFWIISYTFNKEIGFILTGNNDFNNYLINYLVLFSILWHFSNILETILIIEQKTVNAGILTLFFEVFKSIIIIMIGLTGGTLQELLFYLVVLGGIKSILVVYYIMWYTNIEIRFNTELLKSQIIYSFPLGLATIANTLFVYSHQYLVSYFENTSTYAVYAVGCFTLPAISIVIQSIVKISLVKMSSITACENSSFTISRIIQNSIRKLWIIFFPIYVCLFILAEEIIELLFTETYLDAVPIFRVFTLIIPLSALLTQHIPRVFGDTKYILYNNVSNLAFAFILSLILLKSMGPIGSAIGFISSNLLWRLRFLFKSKHILSVELRDLLPIKYLFKSSFIICFTGIVLYFFKDYFYFVAFTKIILFSFVFGLVVFVCYWFFDIFISHEKQLMKRLISYKLL